MPDMDHMNYLEEVQRDDLKQLISKEAGYKGSWKKRGGIGAFMMLARKWDRVEIMAKEAGYDIFALMRADHSGNDGTLLAEIRDLRTYLVLVEAELCAQLAQETVPVGEEDVYSALARGWGCTREEAKRRFYEQGLSHNNRSRRVVTLEDMGITENSDDHVTQDEEGK